MMFDAVTHTRVFEAGADCFFIIGCQRSGTTMLRLVLECHSQIQCWDEAMAYAVISGCREAPARERPRLGIKVPCLTEQLANPSLWDAMVMPETANVYRGQPLLFIVRDVRDTIISMRRLHHYGRPWLDTHLLPTLRAKISRDTAFRRRYAPDIARLETARHRKLARAAFYWRYKVEALFDYLARGFPVLLLRYEDVVKQPSIELLRICGFLQVPWESGLLRHETFPHTALNDKGLAMGGADPTRAIDARSVEQWRDAFSDDELDEIAQFAGELHTSLYPASAS
jgi:hypothetical protein